MEKKLFLLDAFALIYRAFYAFGDRPIINSKGMNTSAIFGFTNTLLDVLKKEKPTHIAVVFDTAEPTLRHIESTDYKANREAMPEGISSAIPYIFKLLQGFKIPIISSDGYEADDIIGTLAKKASLHGFKTFMMTPDKDFGQLVGENIFIYKPARFGNSAEVLDVEAVCKRYEISRPEQVIDILGLMGDKVDNISGIPGIGEKTAIQLIKDFDSIENLLANTDQLKGKLKEKIIEHREKAISSKRLATIICDAPVELNEEELKIEEPDKDVLKKLFEELEFRRLAQQVLGVEPNKPSIVPPLQGSLFDTGEVLIEIEVPLEAPHYKSITDVVHQYNLIDTPEKRKDLLNYLLSWPEISFDTETTGLDLQSAELVGISFSVKPFEAFYVPVPSVFDQALEIVQAFRPVLENLTILKIGQNTKYDICMFKKYGIEVAEPLFDTMIAHYLLQPEMRHNMNVLSENYLQYSPVSIETLIGKKGKGQLSMRDIDLEKIKEYAGEDADITLQLKHKFLPLLIENGTKNLFDEVEIPLVKVLTNMEAEGVRLDKNALSVFSEELGIEIIKVEEEIQGLAGTKFNVSSPKQVGEILFEILKIVEKPQKTKTGQYSTGEDVLSKLAGKHPIINKILDYRELQKLKSTYVDTLPLLVSPVTGKIHTTYNQVVAVTGRLSSDNPNLQNIPIRTDKGKEVRKAFVSRNPDFVILSADYSQIELRIIAELSKDMGMIEAFKSGTDIHTATASKVYNVGLTEVASEMRRNAKMVNFGIIYGISAFGLSERLNIPRKEAASIIEQYFLQYPGIRTYMQENIELARSQGYVETILGRKRYLRDINSANAIVRGFAERNAINAPVQGSAADMIKVAMIRIHDDIQKAGLLSRMILQVHDELVFDAHREELIILKEIIENRMKTAIPLSVPMEIGIGHGNNWLEAH